LKILLTNDDSWDSPLFQLAMDYLQDMGNVKAVVPAEEQSWKGKAMTRFGPVHLKQLDSFASETHTLSGTPADCANFGIYHLFDKKPDLVISGINMGSNAGLGYASSSGTVGAALEANIAGVPSVALSQVLPKDVFDHWVQVRELLPEKKEMLLKTCWAMLDRVFEFLDKQDGFMSEPVTWNVNFPREASDQWQVLPAILGHSVYTTCFKLHEDGYHHDTESPKIEQGKDVDGVILLDGHVTVTRLDIRAFGRT